jgi:hypothetical protein
MAGYTINVGAGYVIVTIPKASVSKPISTT